ncbi:MAG: NAD(P)-binding domain-containing protein [Leptospiraceae bacterium]|nr:NAD(P)-binding domain-containing protein [Leptospiraceae bacterium]MCP5494926.1 NAD(P)-binding domain-containing protein [Leptospiraceae bacterium]
MKITVIGHGNVGGALIRKWAKSGHQIVIGARNPEDQSAKELNQFDSKISVTSIVESIQNTDVIVIAIPAHLTADLAKQLGNLRGRVLIDTTNSVFQKPDPYPTAFDAFQQITEADVVKCFNSTGVENMNNSDYNGVRADMFVAGNSKKGKEIAVQLSKDAGFPECYDFGGDDKVVLLEQLCAIWINLAMMQGLGRHIAFKLLKR